MKNPGIVAVVHLLCLLCLCKNWLFSEATPTQSLTVVERMFLKRNERVLDMKTKFNLCLRKCAKAGLEQVLINLQDCSRKCLKLLKNGRPSFLDGKPRKRRSYDITSQSLKKIFYRARRTKDEKNNVTVLWLNDDEISKLNITTQDPSLPPPTLSKNDPVVQLVQKASNNNDVSNSCQNAIDQISNNSPNPSGEVKSLPLVVNVTFSGGNHGPWQAMASWKYNLTERKRMRNTTGYMVYWNSDSFPTDLYCRKLPQNQTMVNITSSVDDGWEYPDNLYLTVQPIPAIKRNLEFIPFSPKGGVKTTEQVSLPVKDNNLTASQIVAICVGVIAGVVLVAVLLLRVRHIKRSDSTQTLSEGEVSSIAEADVFISYSHANDNDKWVNENLLPLMAQHNIQYLVDYKDFEPGELWLKTMADCMQRSHKILIIMSNEYMNRPNCQTELKQAIYYAQGGKKLIVLRIDDVNKDRLPKAIRDITFIDYADEIERKIWEKKLVNTLKASRSEKKLLTSRVTITWSKGETLRETNV